MKIVFIATVASSIYGFRSDLIGQLLNKGHIVYAFVSEYTDKELEIIKDMGVIPVTYQFSRGGLNPFSDLKATYLLSKQLKKINPDLVFSYFVKPVIFGTFAAKLAKVKKIIGMLEGLGFTFTDQPEGVALKTKIIRAIQVCLYKISLPLLDKLIFLNPDDKTDLLVKYNIKAKQVNILGGIGLELDKYPYSEVDLTRVSNGVKFLFIGRLLKEKGIHEFIGAAKLVKKKYPDAIFTVLGAIDKSNLGAITEEELNQLINSGVIEYPGSVNNVSEWITHHDVFVLPSYYREGVPRSTQEAMAIGRAIITTDVPGCRETVENGVNGFLVNKWDINELAEKMIFFIENPDKILEMGNESYRIAKEKFDVEKVNQRLLKILEV